ncbi:hypothetical protein FH039_11615 [Thermococcus indicus]|uniref:Uncharacterized protein n=1 Tax=Thermococcus indicus TaxID=2586643 RepID=A0A4Y5SMW6_9EURY|nr:DUF257 family protein [Thermococcus indicus]QDA32115.1 hypothetical protein FH039_11615 [Thermococcus indicus]
MVVDNVGRILEGLLPGETVLLEYTSYVMPELLLKSFWDFCAEKGIPMIIDDVLDTFGEYLIKLDVGGFDVEGLQGVPVIKIGGSSRTGNVFGIVDVGRHSLDFGYYESIYTRARGDKFVFNPVLGFHKLFLSLSEREVLRLIRNLASFVGHRDRVAVYVVNSDIAGATFPAHLALFRDVATTVMSFDLVETEQVLRVVKSPNPDLRGSAVSIDLWARDF